MKKGIKSNECYASTQRNIFHNGNVLNRQYNYNNCLK